MATLDELVQEAKSELKEWFDDDNHENEPHDCIFEIADSSTPIYTYDILKMGADNIMLATTEPDVGPAFDGKPTPVNIIAANIFEHIEHELFAYHRELEENRQLELELESEDENV